MGERTAWIQIEELIPGRPHTIKHRLGERALKTGLASLRARGLSALEDGTAPPRLVDSLIQHCLFQRELHPPAA